MSVRKIVSKVMMLTLSGAALVASGMIVSSNSEDVLRDSFAVALNSPIAPMTVATAAAETKAKAKVKASAPIAGSEDFWLTAMRPENALPVTRAVSIGDRIGLRLAGSKLQLVVSSVSELAPQVTVIDTRPEQSRLLLVTATDARNEKAPPVRFLMEVDTSATSVKSAAGRVL